MRYFYDAWKEQWQGEYLGNASTDPCVNSWNSSTVCDSGEIFGFLIRSPEIIPTCITAAIIGYIGFTTIRAQTSAIGHFSYAMSFLMFGIMMSDAAWNDCVLSIHGNQNDDIHWFFGILDVGLTSSVGLSFAFNGLVDIGEINESSTATKLSMLISYALLFCGWYYVFLMNWWAGFFYLYVGVIALSGGFYILVETVHVMRSGDYQGLRTPTHKLHTLILLGWVALGGVSGFVGLSAVAFPSIDLWMCRTFGCHFAGDFLWFVLTDVSMFSLYKYYMARLTQRQQAQRQRSSVNYVLL